MGGSSLTAGGSSQRLTAVAGKPLSGWSLLGVGKGKVVGKGALRVGAQERGVPWSKEMVLPQEGLRLDKE